MSATLEGGEGMEDFDLIVRIKCQHENLEIAKSLMKEISATYSGNCRLRIEVEIDTDNDLPIYTKN